MIETHGSTQAYSNQLQKALDIIFKYNDELKQEARRADKGNFFPSANFEILKKYNLLALNIPLTYGGYGLNFYEYQIFISSLAQFCPSTASALNMHCIILGALADIPLEADALKNNPKITSFIKEIFDKVIKEKKVFASATTEPNIGARYSQTKTTYEDLGGSYKIRGSKAFVTMADYADYFSIIANKKPNENGEPVSSKYLSFFIVPSNHDGVEIIKDWDTLGFRGTQSHRVNFNDVILGEENVFLGVTGLALSKIINQPHWIIAGYSGVYLGIMKAALDFTLSYIKERTDYQQKIGLGFQPLLQSKLSQMYILFENTRSTIFNASQRVLSNSRSKETHRSLYMAKHQAGENAIALTSLAIKTCGGMSIHRRFDLERLFRDSRCGALMPSVSDACELYIAQNLLDIPIEGIW